jgi:hypothetical protein
MKRGRIDDLSGDVPFKPSFASKTCGSIVAVAIDYECSFTGVALLE